MNDLVSIITPAYNSEKFIGETIESVLAQTYDNWEMIIVDDCSKDRTESIIKKYIDKDNRINYYRLDKNSGAAVARNRGIEVSRGKYLAFIDSDDVWFKEKLAKQINFMKENDYSFTCTSYTKIDEIGKDLNDTRIAMKKRDYNGVLKRSPGNSTAIFDVEKLGKFKIPNIRKRNDYALWLKVIKESKYLYGIKEPFSSHRVRTGSLSKNKIGLVKYQWEVYRELEKLSFLKSTYLLMYHTIATIFKLK